MGRLVVLAASALAGLGVVVASLNPSRCVSRRATIHG
jgi:hypothetical protein